MKKTCINCYGKGYATSLNMLYGAADFTADEEFRTTQVQIVPCCKCQKWMRSKKTRDKANEEAMSIMKQLT